MYVCINVCMYFPLILLRLAAFRGLPKHEWCNFPNSKSENCSNRKLFLKVATVTFQCSLVLSAMEHDHGGCESPSKDVQECVGRRLKFFAKRCPWLVSYERRSCGECWIRIPELVRKRYVWLSQGMWTLTSHFFIQYFAYVYPEQIEQCTMHTHSRAGAANLQTISCPWRWVKNDWNSAWKCRNTFFRIWRAF